MEDRFSQTLRSTSQTFWHFCQRRFMGVCAGVTLANVVVLVVVPSLLAVLLTATCWTLCLGGLMFRATRSDGRRNP